MRASRTGAAAVLTAVLLMTSTPARAAQGATVEGRVTSPNGRPIDNVRIALLSDTYSPLRQGYTDGSGRYRFTVAGAGSFYIEVDPLSLPFERQQQRVEVNPAPFSHGGEIFHVDIVLTPKKSGDPVRDSSGVRFYQDVPEAARAAYARGTGLLAKDPEAAFAEWRKALELFPDYYACMETLGSELVKVDKLDDAYPLLTHAVQVNPSGELSYYALGVIYYKSRRYPEAIQSFEKSTSLNPKSANAALYLGLALVRDHKPGDGERQLKRAYELGAKGVADLHLALASVYIEAKRSREAAAQLRLLLKEVPNLKDRDKIKGLIDKLEKEPS